MTIDPKRLIFLHGLESSSQSSKAVLLRSLFPGMLTPDFTGSLEERMAQLAPILGDATGWMIIGSSFGGLMGALFTCQHPHQVRKLILLAPALNLPAFAENLPAPVDVPTVVIHGTQDDVVPLEPVRALAKRVFRNLTYHVVEDGHRLQKTVPTLDWKALLE
ncbi:MAG: alpha/beta fold hydrolase [Anaerolineae bacterium]|nr:MAG: alpha/beta fold hydrolase [Anaerolineae bacterium]